jgi:ferredoxin
MSRWGESCVEADFEQQEDLLDRLAREFFRRTLASVRRRHELLAQLAHPVRDNQRRDRRDRPIKERSRLECDSRSAKRSSRIDRAHREGHCSSVGECEAVCPKEIPIAFIARMNRDYLEASITECPQASHGGSG